ncbi:hypothetical protein HD598_001731 [Neomicrococcus aestuarii]|uniref:Uncharacterized protein n=1 Tax=Neomicrococcus aestuarii TaxID=556325 RepID=A0A7W8TUG5_9MICC|nr:hypothetical protein [Neomicrococcus aestuarii]
MSELLVGESTRVDYYNYCGSIQNVLALHRRTRCLGLTQDGVEWRRDRFQCGNQLSATTRVCKALTSIRGTSLRIRRPSEESYGFARGLPSLVFESIPLKGPHRTWILMPVL